MLDGGAWRNSEEADDVGMPVVSHDGLLHGSCRSCEHARSWPEPSSEQQPLRRLQHVKRCAALHGEPNNPVGCTAYFPTNVLRVSLCDLAVFAQGKGMLFPDRAWQ